MALGAAALRANCHPGLDVFLFPYETIATSASSSHSIKNCADAELFRKTDPVSYRRSQPAVYRFVRIVFAPYEEKSSSYASPKTELRPSMLMRHATPRASAGPAHSAEFQRGPGEHDLIVLCSAIVPHEGLKLLKVGLSLVFQLSALSLRGDSTRIIMPSSQHAALPFLACVPDTRLAFTPPFFHLHHGTAYQSYCLAWMRNRNAGFKEKLEGVHMDTLCN
ncbi:hypothetical protein EDB84DRAFT_1606668 [Lactarius hengduanensis]|nr:hypothetical protein EDB84DRAFT_1606668 [Lactarius hengduanensis]